MRTILLLCGLFFLACSDEAHIQQSDIVGEWRSENAFINDVPASELLENGIGLYSSILGFRADGTYYLNYNSGTWQLEENIISLSNAYEYEVIDFKDSIMTLETIIPANSLYWKLDGIDADENIVLKEDYRKY